MRGINASVLHGMMKHVYFTVDTSFENWEEIVLHKVNEMDSGCAVHVIEHGTMKEIKKIYS